MFTQTYNNFVRSTSPLAKTGTQTLLSGEEARKIYLEEVKDVKTLIPANKDKLSVAKSMIKRKVTEINVSDNNIFLTVENNKVDNLREILDAAPDKINIVDDFGWSLLMIACQANSIETVQELLKRGVDTTVRDKAGNSAQSLVIKNRNIVLADLLLRFKYNEKINKSKSDVKLKKAKQKEDYHCEICNCKVTHKQDHLSSTVHNINASKGRKIPTNYGIPESNKGYQIMLKVGWDKESGLGPDGSGNKYPIKAKQKKDRKGLGHDKKNTVKKREECIEHKKRKILTSEYQNNRRMEINFRREFY